MLSLGGIIATIAQASRYKFLREKGQATARAFMRPVAGFARRFRRYTIRGYNL